MRYFKLEAVIQVIQNCVHKGTNQILKFCITMVHVHIILHEKRLRVNNFLADFHR
jgi:hypothetical protein